MTIVLADLGGTHLRLARSHDLKNIEKFVIRDFPDIDMVLREYEEKIETLYIAAAIQPIEGIIEDKRFGDKSDWVIDINKLKSALNIKNIVIVNDLEAAAYGVLKLKHNQTQFLIEPEIEQFHFSYPPKLIVGVGTGIGHAYLFDKENSRPFVQRSHGGHMPIPVASDEQMETVQKIRLSQERKRDFIVEDIVSGSGLIGLKAHYGDDIALRLFAEFLGVYCNVLVSNVGAYGGVYLTGGVMDELVGRQQFDKESFKKYFLPRAVPVVQECLNATPVYYVREPNMPILGLSFLSRQEAHDF